MSVSLETLKSKLPKKLQEAIKVRSRQLTEYLIMKVTIEDAVKYIESVEDDSAEKSALLMMLKHCATIFDRWIEQVLQKVAEQAVAELEQEKTQSGE